MRPGHLEATVEWFRKYKVPDGKPENQFGFKGQFQDKVQYSDLVNTTVHTYCTGLSAQAAQMSCTFGNKNSCDSDFYFPPFRTLHLRSSSPPMSTGGH